MRHNLNMKVYKRRRTTGSRRTKRMRRSKRSGSKLQYRLRSIGGKRKVDTKKALTGYVVNVSRVTRSLLNAEISDIDKGTAIHQRLRDSVDLRGFRVNIRVVNVSEERRPINFHWAIIAPKNGTSVPNSDFFRTANNTKGRGQDFNTDLAGVDFDTNPINTDKYTVVTHQKCHLAARYNIIDNSPAQLHNINGFKNYRKFDTYVPIKRTLVYDRTDDTTLNATFCTTPIFIVYWCDFHDSGQFSQSTTASAILITLKVTASFNDNIR